MWLLQSRGLRGDCADDSVLHACRNSNVREAILDMCRIENMLVCVRMSFLARALALPLPQLKSFLINDHGHQQPCEDPYVWLARDVTITSMQGELIAVHKRWKSVLAAASAATTVLSLWRQEWRWMWQKAGMVPQLHGVNGSSTSEIDMQAACSFENKFLDWAQASCKSLWQPAIGYGACLKMVEQALECVCCLMEVPMLQRTVYSRIGGELLLDVVCPHRRHLKILQLWIQVPRLFLKLYAISLNHRTGHIKAVSTDSRDLISRQRCGGRNTRQYTPSLRRHH